jgi:hypothetical protein
MMIRNVALLALLLAGVSAKKDGPFATYTAEIMPIPGSGLTSVSVTGTVVVFAGDDKGSIGYGGFAEGLEPGSTAEKVSPIHRAGVSFVKLADSIHVYLNDLVLFCCTHLLIALF